MGGKRVTDLEIETVFAHKKEGFTPTETAKFMDIDVDRVYYILNTYEPMTFLESILFSWFGVVQKNRRK